MYKQNIKEVLIENGISPSRPRLAIFNYLQGHFTHPTAEEIFRDLKGEVATLSLTTVYNTLRLFSDKGLCLSLTINEKQVCYDGYTKPHGHFLCTKCGKVHDIPYSSEQLNVGNEYIDGHLITETHCYYRGICSKCLSVESMS